MKCEFPTCSEQATQGNFCFQHFRVYGRKEATKKVRKPIAKFSEKRKAESPEYRAFVAKFLSQPENKICNIQAPGCTWKATTINHLKRRFKDTKMNSEFVEPCCANCNAYIEQNDLWARENGHLLSKYKV